MQCKNSPDGYHEYYKFKSDGLMVWAVCECGYTLQAIKVLERLNAAERLSAEQMQVAAMLDDDDIHDILDRKATEAYAARRKDGE